MSATTNYEKELLVFRLADVDLRPVDIHILSHDVAQSGSRLQQIVFSHQYLHPAGRFGAETGGVRAGHRRLNAALLQSGDDDACLHFRRRRFQKHETLGTFRHEVFAPYSSSGSPTSICDQSMWSFSSCTCSKICFARARSSSATMTLTQFHAPARRPDVYSSVSARMPFSSSAATTIAASVSLGTEVKTAVRSFGSSFIT